MHGPEYLSDEELLSRAIAREDELERPCASWNEAHPSWSGSGTRPGMSASASRRPYEELEEASRKERTAHKETKELSTCSGMTAVVLLVVSVLVSWLVLT